MRIKSTYEDRKEDFSRYRNLKRLVFDDNSKRIETMGEVEIPEKDGDIFYKVTPQYENRLDLVAYKFYHNPLYWWVIAYASDIKDPFNVPSDTILRIPSTTTLYSLEEQLYERTL